MNEVQQRYAEMHGRLKESGMLPHDDPGWFVNPFETGHWSYFHIPGHSRNWHMDVHHPGDPEGSIVRADLGSDDSKVPEHAMRTLRHPDVVKAMGAQWQRATSNGDPRGDNPAARTIDPPTYPERISRLFQHYP